MIYSVSETTVGIQLRGRQSRAKVKSTCDLREGRKTFCNSDFYVVKLAGAGQTLVSSGRRTFRGDPKPRGVPTSYGLPRDKQDPAATRIGDQAELSYMTTWFCDAYASWQKGGIENANGRLRRWPSHFCELDSRLPSFPAFNSLRIKFASSIRRCLIPFLIPSAPTLSVEISMRSAMRDQSFAAIAGES